jgi:hypothetical protein
MGRNREEQKKNQANTNCSIRSKSYHSNILTYYNPTSLCIRRNYTVIRRDNLMGRSIVLVVGHSNEPAYGAKPGIPDGLHGLK